MLTHVRCRIEERCRKAKVRGGREGWGVGVRVRVRVRVCGWVREAECMFVVSCRLLMATINTMMFSFPSSAQAPFTNARDMLTRVFRRVDQGRTGRVSLQQFLQVWQNVMQLMEVRNGWLGG